MLTYPKSTMRVRSMPMHLSSGHVTLMPGKFFPRPSFDVDAESVSEEFQMEVLDLKCDKQKQQYTDMVFLIFTIFFPKKVFELVSAASEIAK